MKEQDIAAFVAQWLTEQLKREVTSETHFSSLGLDSLDVVRLTDALAEKLGADELPVELVMDHPTVSALATHLATLAK